MMNQLYLLRHGEYKANLTKELSHKLNDYPLNDKGRLQAQQTAQFLRNKGIHAIFTSPLKRALNTAEIVGKVLGLEPIIIEAFRELNVGDLEKVPPTKENWMVLSNVIRSWMAGNPDEAFPNGEDYHQLWARYKQGLLDAIQTHPNQTLLIVGHGGIFTFTLQDLCPSINFNNTVHSINHNASLTRINLTLRDNHLVGKLIDWANTDHLSGIAAELTHPALQNSDLENK